MGRDRSPVGKINAVPMDVRGGAPRGDLSAQFIEEIGVLRHPSARAHRGRIQHFARRFEPLRRSPDTQKECCRLEYCGHRFADCCGFLARFIVFRRKALEHDGKKNSEMPHLYRGIGERLLESPFFQAKRSSFGLSLDKSPGIGGCKGCGGETRALPGIDKSFDTG